MLAEDLCFGAVRTAFPLLLSNLPQMGIPQVHVRPRAPTTTTHTYRMRAKRCPRVLLNPLELQGFIDMFIRSYRISIGQSRICSYFSPSLYAGTS